MDKRIRTNTKKYTDLKNFKLIGTEKLCVDKTVKVVEITTFQNEKTKRFYEEKRVVSKEDTVMEFELEEIAAEELLKKRKTDVPGFVLKREGKLYYSKIFSNLKLLSTNILGQHKCADHNELCSGLKNHTDMEIGCLKVLQGSVGIERYDWIRLGYETFNTFNDCFVVSVCDHYK